MQTIAILQSLAMTTLLGAAGPDDGACAATRSTAHRTQVVELYTSEGCNSCPPADRWLRGLAPRDDLVVVAFHVDYWDRLGWKDPWGDPRHSARQQWRAARSGARVVYTPDVVFDGRSRTDWPRGWMPATAIDAAPFDLALRASVRGDGHLRVEWSGSGAPAGAGAWVAVTQSGLGGTPARGENAGVPLRHSHVVRAFADGLVARGGTLDLALPEDLDAAAAHVQLVVEDLASARPLHGTGVSLRGCAIDRRATAPP